MAKTNNPRQLELLLTERQFAEWLDQRGIEFGTGQGYAHAYEVWVKAKTEERSFFFDALGDRDFVFDLMRSGSLAAPRFDDLVRLRGYDEARRWIIKTARDFSLVTTEIQAADTALVGLNPNHVILDELEQRDARNPDVIKAREKVRKASEMAAKYAEQAAEQAAEGKK